MKYSKEELEYLRATVRTARARGYATPSAVHRYLATEPRCFASTAEDRRYRAATTTVPDFAGKLLELAELYEERAALAQSVYDKVSAASERLRHG